MAINLYDQAANAKALEQISNAVANIVQPYKAQEQALRIAMTRDPSLAQKLTDLEAINPGSIEKFAGPNAGKYFSALDSTPETKARIAERPATEVALSEPENLKYGATKEALGATPGEVAQSGLKEGLAKKGVEVLETMPDVALSGGIKQVTGLTAGKNASDQQLKRRADSVQKALQLPNLQQEYVNLVTGKESKLTWLDMSAIADDPAAKHLLIPFIETMRTNRYLQGLKAAEIRAYIGQGDNMNKLWLGKAIDMVAKSGKGTTGAFLKLWGADQELIDSVGGYTPQQLQEAIEAQDLISSQSDVKGLRGAIDANQKLLINWDKFPEEIKNTMINTMNDNARAGNLPRHYTMDSDGELVTIDMQTNQVITKGGGTSSTEVGGSAGRGGSSTPENKVPPGQTKPVGTGGGKAGVTVKTKEKGQAAPPPVPTYVPTPEVEAVYKAVGNLTLPQAMDKIKDIDLTDEERSYILSGVKKKSKP